ncbi:hemicentin-2-like [Mya arenaria]|uniref:hemicentin-2-like n=1 Tax=Mya arenaria TaxID=6604 RepID=UPI0022E7041B|nr:hemicentin-2-like [Mya arenaria]
MAIKMAASFYLASANLSKYTRLEGDNLLVRCNATESDDIEIYWQKNGTEHQPYRQNGTDFIVFNIKRAFSGQYICYALNTTFYPYYNETGANVTVDVITVDVEYPAEVDRFSIFPTVVHENETWLIECNFQGNPRPTWSIFNRDTGEGMMSAIHATADVTLGPNKARCESMGHWTCTGHNRLSHHKNATGEGMLTVYCSPRPQWAQVYIEQGEKGKPARLEMNFTAYPVPKITWSRDDGRPVLAQIDTWKNRTIMFWDKLNPVKVSDFGNYTLTMTNEYGTYTSHYQLKANGYPETPTNVSISDVTYDSVTITWTSGFDMGSRQHFIVMKMFDGHAFSSLSGWIEDNSTTHGINQTWSYQLTGLDSDTFYNISMVAENREFMSGFSKPFITFWTKAAPPMPEDYTLSSSSLAIVVGASLGALAFLGTLAYLVYFFKWRKMRIHYVKK